MRAVLPGKPQAKLQAVVTALWEGQRLVVRNYNSPSRIEFIMLTTLVKAYISGNALVILSGPHSLIQTIYNDQLLALEAVVIDEATGKIAICSLEEVHIFKPYGKKEGALKVRPETRDSRLSCEVLTTYSGHFSPLCSFQATEMAR